MSTAEGGQQVSRPLQIVLGVVVALAALFALWTFVLSPLLGGDDAADLAGNPLTPPTAAGQPTADPNDPQATPVPEDGDPLGDALLGAPVPETFEIFTARDPFQQLVVEAGTVAAEAVTGEVVSDEATPEPTATPTTGAAVSTPSTTTTGSSSTTTNDSTSEAPDDSADGISSQGDGVGEIYEPTPSQAGNTEITLASVTNLPTESLTITVNAEDYTVTEGEVFADRFQLLDIDGACAIFLFGDSRFTLCEGDTIIK